MGGFDMYFLAATGLPRLPNHPGRTKAPLLGLTISSRDLLRFRGTALGGYIDNPKGIPLCSHDNIFIFGERDRDSEGAIHQDMVGDSAAQSISMGRKGIVLDFYRITPQKNKTTLKQGAPLGNWGQHQSNNLRMFVNRLLSAPLRKV